MAKYIIQGETLKAIADEVRDLTDITDEINPSEMIANMEQANADVAAQTEIIEQIRTALDGKAGSNAAEIGALIDQSGVLDSTEGTVEEKVEQVIDKAEDSDLWYEYTKNMTALPSDFRNTQIEKLPRMDFSKVTSLSYGFSTMPLKKVDCYINSGNCGDFNTAFGNCKQLEYIKGINLAKATYTNGLFRDCIVLKTIGEPLDLLYFSENTAESRISMFYNSVALENVRIVPESIKKCFICAHTSVLTAESIQSIFDGLATVETAQTLTLHKDAKILQSQVDSANAKGWTIAGGTVVSEEEYYG